MRIDWTSLKKVRDDLEKNANLNDDTSLLFIIKPHKNESVKANVKFKDFLKMFFTLSEERFKIIQIMVFNTEHELLYKLGKDLEYSENKPLTTPETPNTIAEWNTFNSFKKSALMKILLSQIGGSNV